jgi:hydrogenase maturation protease
MTTPAVVIGIGNSFRRDDGVGPAVAAAVGRAAAPDVHVTTDPGDPTAILDAWAGAHLAVIIDAAVLTPSTPGRIHRYAMSQLPTARTVSSHGVNIVMVLALGEALGQLPEEAVLFAVEVSDTDFGVGLSPKVAEAVPRVVDAVMTEITRGSFG